MHSAVSLCDADTGGYDMTEVLISTRGHVRHHLLNVAGPAY